MNETIQIMFLCLIAYSIGVYLGYALRKAQEK
jgi:hypothetical protein